ncbi:PREDICTED: uncharacterized protein LOC106338678 [Brassica oleracea var. oleracea]|uniref:uncharacterized protein LOC106338678 n=1 Tax=Brassica oleracea var. oleracea TaxID=109376 RepID=UPI0006A71C6E|nr:PREDICTED: uncharacterized protein LOC106338678 [Brassica oleracea var. oleracea]
MDYKSVDEYNSVLFKTVSMLRLCGEVVTEEELLEKTFSTFHSSNIILQQQYRMKGFATYTDLISCLLLAEANNELLMKNSEARPVGTATLPEANEVEKKDPNECNYIQNDKRSHGKGQGGYRNRDPDNYSNNRDKYLAGRKGHHNNCGRGSNPGRGRGGYGRSGYGRGRGGISKPSYSTKSVFHRCGMSNHWAKNCRTLKHLCELYQESLKNKNPEAHMVHDSGYEADDDSDTAKDDLMDFETSDWTEKNGQAQEGIAALRDNVDTLIVIPNDMLLTAVSLFRLLFQKHSIWQMICFVKGYRGISDNITILGLVNVDFADVRAIMANAGSSLMGVGTATERSVLVITIIIIIIFGTVVDPSFSGQVSITLIATGFKRQEEGERKPLQGTQVDASMGVTRRSSSSFTEGSEIEEELRDMKAHKAYYNMLHFVANAQQGIPKMCPCGSITKEVVDEEDTYDYLPGKRYFICKDYENDGMHFRQPWVMGMQQEVERLKERFHEQEKLLRECEALKGQVRMLLMRVAELEKRNLPVSN